MEEAVLEDLRRSARFIKEFFQLSEAANWIALRAELEEMEDEEEGDDLPTGYPTTMSWFRDDRLHPDRHHERKSRIGGSKMNIKGKRVDGKVANLRLRKQGPWLILRLYHPDGCRFFDQFAGTITGEDKKAITEDSQRLTSPSL